VPTGRGLRFARSKSAFNTPGLREIAYNGTVKGPLSAQWAMVSKNSPIGCRRGPSRICAFCRDVSFGMFVLML